MIPAPDSVRNNTAASRYELDAHGDLCIAAYRPRGDAFVFTHTQVPRALEGKGLGSRLIRGALADVRAQGRTIVAECAFVAAYLARHPEERDLLAG